uniref:Uncharacterized protein n=1 Tax=Setaria italica TaxID=4555 RepID=K3YF08_SETIT
MADVGGTGVPLMRQWKGKARWGIRRGEAKLKRHAWL